jgi:hypothetical protein
MTKKRPIVKSQQARGIRSRDNASEQQRRNELARRRGFRSRSEERKYSRHVATAGDLNQLPLSAQLQRERSLRVIASMRENRTLSLPEAARREGTTPEAVVWFGEGSVTKVRGRWRASDADRLLRQMYVYSNGQIVEVSVRGSRKASELARYFNAVRLFREEGDDAALQDFEGRSVTGHVYETDLDILEEMARRDVLSIEDVYSLVAI